MAVIRCDASENAMGVVVERARGIVGCCWTMPGQVSVLWLAAQSLWIRSHGYISCSMMASSGLIFSVCTE